MRLPINNDMPLVMDEARYIINPGSVGQPRDRDPRAAYLWYDPDAATIVWKRVRYDIVRAQAKIRAAGLPNGWRPGSPSASKSAVLYARAYTLPRVACLSTSRSLNVVPHQPQIRLHRQLVVAINGGAVDPIILDLAATISKRDRTQVAVVYVVEVAQQLPVDADLPQDWSAASACCWRRKRRRGNAACARRTTCCRRRIGRRGDCR